MSRSIILLLASPLILATAPPPAAQQTQSLAVAVTDLRDQGVGSEISATLTDVLVIELGRFDELRVIGRQDMVAMLEQAALLQALGSCEQEGCWAEVGTALQARYVVHGSVGEVSGAVTITVRLIDVASAKVLGSAAQSLRGDPDDLVAALRAAAVNLVSGFLYGETRTQPVTISMVETLKTARRDKVWDVGLRVGGGMLTTDTEILRGPLLSCRLDGELALLPWLLVGATLGFDWQRTDTTGDLFFGDYGSGTIVKSDTRSEAELLAGFGALSAKARPAHGLVLPYAVLSVGGGYLEIALGDVIPERDDLPQFLTRIRKGGSGPTFYADAGAGVEVLLLDRVAINLDLRLFGYFHGVREQQWPSGFERSDETRLLDRAIGPILGAQVLLGATWQN